MCGWAQFKESLNRNRSVVISGSAREWQRLLDLIRQSFAYATDWAWAARSPYAPARTGQDCGRPAQAADARHFHEALIYQRSLRPIGVRPTAAVAVRFLQLAPAAGRRLVRALRLAEAAGDTTVTAAQCGASPWAAGADWTVLAGSPPRAPLQMPAAGGPGFSGPGKRLARRRGSGADAPAVRRRQVEEQRVPGPPGYAAAGQPVLSFSHRLVIGSWPISQSAML